MAEYIKREAALEICETEYQKRLRMLDYCGDTVAWNIGSEIKALPAADVAPVVHGRWAHLGGDEWCCSACGFVITTEGSWDKPTKKYCEDCGARMDGDDDAKAD